MKSNKEIENEIVNRLCKMKEKRRGRRILALGVASSLSAIALVIFGVSIVEKNVKSAVQTNPNVAAIFVDSAVGGYIAVALVSFVVGVIVTAICLKTTGGGKDD